MKVKLDENLPASLAEHLAAKGIDVDTVLSEGLGGRSDPDVLDAARKAERILFTLDRGFGDIRYHPPGTHPGIVVFRPDDQSPESTTKAVDALVDHHDLTDLAGTVTVVQRGILRIRRAET